MGFVLACEGIEAGLPCRHVLGFREALVAAQDPAVAMPARLVIVEPSSVTDDFLARWAEDDEQVRRTITICRRHDEARVTTVVTLAAYGRGAVTSLSVESVTLPSHASHARKIVRSGVHPKSFLDAVLARHVRAGASAGAGAGVHEPTEPA